MQKLPERAGSARSRADRVPIPRVEGVEAARNRDFGDLDVFWSAGEDLVSAKSASSGRDHVLDIVCGSVNKARPFTRCGKLQATQTRSSSSSRSTSRAAANRRAASFWAPARVFVAHMSSCVG